MKRNKNLRVCNDLLKKLQALNKEKPGMWSKLEKARKKLNRAKPDGMISQQDFFEAAREIAEAVLKCTDGKE